MDGGCDAKVRPSVASATEGAAPKIPAKLFGASTSPMTAKAETMRPAYDEADYDLVQH
jgi:hypothetical protein